MGKLFIQTFFFIILKQFNLNFKLKWTYTTKVESLLCIFLVLFSVFPNMNTFLWKTTLHISHRKMKYYFDKWVHFMVFFFENVSTCCSFLLLWLCVLKIKKVFFFCFFVKINETLSLWQWGREKEEIKNFPILTRKFIGFYLDFDNFYLLWTFYFHLLLSSRVC
jgi:hypothetical protein